MTSFREIGFRTILAGLLLTLVCGFLILEKNIGRYLSLTEEGFRAVALINADLGEDESAAIQEQIRKIDGISTCERVEVMNTEQYGDLETLRKHGMIGVPRNIEYGFEDLFSSSERVGQINTRILSIDGVREVIFDEKSFDKTVISVRFLSSVLFKSSLILFVFFSLFFFLIFWRETKLFGGGAEKGSGAVLRGAVLRSKAREGAFTGLAGALFALLACAVMWRLWFISAEVRIIYLNIVEAVLFLISATVWAAAIALVVGRVEAGRRT